MSCIDANPKNAICKLTEGIAVAKARLRSSIGTGVDLVGGAVHERGQVETTLDELIVTTVTHLDHASVLLLLLLLQQDRVNVVSGELTVSLLFRRHALPVVVDKLPVELRAWHDTMPLMVLDSESAVAWARLTQVLNVVRVA